MKTLRLSLILVGTLLIAGMHTSAASGSASAPGAERLSAGALKQLAGVRAATARFQDVAQAEAEGYVNINFCEPGEGCHWLNPSLVDDSFDLEHPEILLYAPGSGRSWRLVAVEYVVPLSLAPNSPPQGFTGNEDIWREDTEGAGLWELTTWVWLHNPNGMFEQHNPRLP